VHGLYGPNLVPTFADKGVSRSQRDGSLRPYSRISRQEPLRFLPNSSSIILTRLSEPRDQYQKSHILHSMFENIGVSRVFFGAIPNFKDMQCWNRQVKLMWGLCMRILKKGTIPTEYNFEESRMYGLQLDWTGIFTNINQKLYHLDNWAFLSYWKSAWLVFRLWTYRYISEALMVSLTAVFRVFSGCGV
jgi:hypothetical protein